MPIPTPQDAGLAEIDNLANMVMVKLRIMRHANRGARDIQGLRDALQEYVELCMEFARSCG